LAVSILSAGVAVADTRAESEDGLKRQVVPGKDSNLSFNSLKNNDNDVTQNISTNKNTNRVGRLVLVPGDRLVEDVARGAPARAV
jgi:ethanolamine utilization microcompartment shell protein EutS